MSASELRGHVLFAASIDAEYCFPKKFYYHCGWAVRSLPEYVGGSVVGRYLTFNQLGGPGLYRQMDLLVAYHKVAVYPAHPANSMTILAIVTVVFTACH